MSRLRAARWRRIARLGRDSGMATVELAVALPVLVLFVLAGCVAVNVVRVHVVASDGAREIARSLARSDDVSHGGYDRFLPEGARVQTSADQDTVTVRVTVPVQVMGGWLAPVTVTASATAYLEPGCAGTMVRSCGSAARWP